MARLRPRSRLRSRLRSSSALASTLAFVLGRRGDLVWNTLILVTVFLPLAGLSLDVPRYFVLRSRLQNATDAATQAAVQQVDIPCFQNTGETQLKDTYAGEAYWAFNIAVASLRSHGYTATLDSLQRDEVADAVTATASGTMRLFYNLTPPVTVRVSTTSQYRITRG